MQCGPLSSVEGRLPRAKTVDAAKDAAKNGSASAPKRLLWDPDADVFRILSPGEISATVNRIKGLMRLVGVLTENCRARVETFRGLLASLSLDGTTVKTRLS